MVPNATVAVGYKGFLSVSSGTLPSSVSSSDKIGSIRVSLPTCSPPYVVVSLISVISSSYVSNISSSSHSPSSISFTKVVSLSSRMASSS